MIGLASEDAPADFAVGGGEEDLRRLEMEPEVLLRCDGGFRRWSSSAASPPPIAKSAGASSPANPITLRSTWLRQRGCTLVASLFYSTCYIYILSTEHTDLFL